MQEIVKITEQELIGTDAVRNILILDTSGATAGSTATCSGYLRAYAIVPSSKSNAGSPPAFSYLYDSTYLFADFIRYYQINLQTVSLHWFVFQALLEGLPEDSCTKQRIAYRCINLGVIKDKKERNRLAQIQRAVAIPRRPMTAGEVGNLFG